MSLLHCRSQKISCYKLLYVHCVITGPLLLTCIITDVVCTLCSVVWASNSGPMHIWSCINIYLALCTGTYMFYAAICACPCAVQMTDKHEHIVCVHILFCWDTVCITTLHVRYIRTLIVLPSYSVAMCRLLVNRARVIAQQYRITYNESIPVSQLVQKVATVMQEYTQQG